MSAHENAVTVSPDERAAEIEALVRRQLPGARFEANRWGGFDVSKSSVRKVRVAIEDGEAQVYVFNANLVLFASATFSSNFAADMIWPVVCAYTI